METCSASAIGGESTSWSEDKELTDAAECKELSPIEHLDIDKLLKDGWSSEGANEQEEEEDVNMRAASAVNVEEHCKKMMVFNQINNENYDENILYRSRRLKVVEATSPSETEKGIVEIAQLARADDDVERETKEEPTEKSEEINDKQEQNEEEPSPGGSAETISRDRKTK